MPLTVFLTFVLCENKKEYSISTKGVSWKNLCFSFKQPARNPILTYEKLVFQLFWVFNSTFRLGAYLSNYGKSSAFDQKSLCAKSQTKSFMYIKNLLRHIQVAIVYIYVHNHEKSYLLLKSCIMYFESLQQVVNIH